MATFDPTNLEFTFLDVPANNEYPYNGMPLAESMPEAGQIIVLFEAQTVFKDAPNGTEVPVDTLSDELQAQIQTLDASFYSIDEEADTITIPDFGGQQIPIPNITDVYYYAAGAAPSPTSPIRLRRSTDINTPVVTFAPGGRLTADVLNASATQLLHASQELAAFSSTGGSTGGSGGTPGTPDLSANLLSDLGNVDFPTGSGVLTYDQNTSTWSAGAAGNLVPAGDGVGPQTPVTPPGGVPTTDTYYLAKGSTTAGDYEWYPTSTITNPLQLLIASNGNNINALQGKTLNQTAINSPGFEVSTSFAGDVKASKFEVPNGYLSYDNTTINQSDGVTPYNNVQLNIPGGDTGGGSYITVNEDNSVIRNTNSTGYEWFYQSGNTYDDSSTWIQDGAILIDPRCEDSSGNTYNRILNTEGTGYSYQNHFMIQGRANRSMWRWDQNNYTYVIAPGDESGVVFTSVKEIDGVARNIFTVDDDGNGFFRGNVTANGVFVEGSDATTKTYIPGQDPAGSVIDKIQNLSTLGAFEYDDQPGVYHYGPTTQDLTAVGLDIARGVNIDVPAGPTEEATDETGASGGSAAEASTQTIETISMTGLLTKAAAELKDLDDALDARVTTNETDIASNDAEIASLLAYVTALEARVAALEGVDPNPPPTPG